MPRPAGSTVPLLAMPEAGISRAVYPEIVAGQDGVGRGLTLEQRVHDLLTVILRAHPHLSQRPDPSAAAWVVVLALENLTMRWILDQPRITRDALLDEIEALVGGYAQMKPKELPQGR